VERLRSIRECERQIDWWSRTLPSLRLRQQRQLHKKQRTPYSLANEQKEGT